MGDALYFDRHAFRRDRQRLFRSEREAARKGGISRATLQFWESGERSPNLASLGVVAAAWGADMARWLATKLGQTTD